MPGPGRPRKNPPKESPPVPAPTREPQSEPADGDPDAIEIKAYIPRPELVEAGLDAQRSGVALRSKHAQSRQRTPPELGIECKNCGSLFLETTHTSPRLGSVRRRRRCLRCGFAWHTIEAPEGAQDTGSKCEDEG